MLIVARVAFEGLGREAHTGPEGGRWGDILNDDGIIIGRVAAGCSFLDEGNEGEGFSSSLCLWGKRVGEVGGGMLS